MKDTLHYLISYTPKSKADKKLFEQTMEAVSSTGAKVEDWLAEKYYTETPKKGYFQFRVFGYCGVCKQIGHCEHLQKSVYGDK